MTGQEFPCTEQGIRDAIAEGGGPHTFDCGGPRTVVTESEMIIDNDVILDGGGNLTVDGDEKHTVFRVSNGTIAELHGFDVTGGFPRIVDNGGGGILNKGTLSVTAVTVSGNVCGGGCVGGGIRNEGTITLTNSTVSGNTGDPITGTGGGLHNDNGATMTLINSTVSGNTGGISNEGTLMLTSGTLSGSIQTLAPGSASVAFKNTVIRGECTERDVRLPAMWTSNGNNIESPGDTCGFDQATDLVNVTEGQLNVGELAENGGLTKTHALGEGSVAIDHIPGAACEVNEDQRGEPRPGRSMCDVGSFEVQPECDTVEECNDDNECTQGACTDGICAYTPVEDGTECFFEGVCVGGTCRSLCENVEECETDFNDCTADVCALGGYCDHIPVEDGTECAGGMCQAGACELTGSVLPCSEQGIRNAIAVGGGPYTFDCNGPATVIAEVGIGIDNDVVLDGEGNLTVDGNESADETIGVSEGVTAELYGITVIRGREVGLDNHGTLTLVDSIVWGNPQGISNGGSLLMMGVTVSDNGSVADEAGGGISNSGALTMTNSTVSGNEMGADSGGSGAIFNGGDGTVSIVNSTVSGNRTFSDMGGGIHTEGNRVNITNSTVAGNTPAAIHNSGEPVTLTNTLIDGECQGSITSNGNNVESPGDTCGFDDSTDQTGVIPRDLRLEPLADNGGPTETHALGAGSVAVDQIHNAVCKVDEDQRGVERPQGFGCDVGSFERQPEDP